jgi:hypothetical protein
MTGSEAAVVAADLLDWHAQYFKNGLGGVLVGVAGTGFSSQ